MGKKVLILGKGGREHALAHVLSRSKSVEKIFIAPGNGGTSNWATTASIELKAPFTELKKFVKEKGIDLVVVGPEEYLVQSVVDELEKEGIKAFGPSGAAAELEGSKMFAKEMMKKAGVPTASYRIVTTLEEAKDFVSKHPLPLVFKADGLAGGKGVMVIMEEHELQSAYDNYFVGKKFGKAGQSVLIETFLKGFEASLFVLTDGKDYKLFPFCQDHKRAFDMDKGPNTGGMGVYLPVKGLNEKHMESSRKWVVEPMLKVMRDEGKTYKGILYVGLMIDGDELNVVEFNCRFGDPEAQCVLPLVESDFYELALSCVDGTVAKQELRLRNESSCVVVVAKSGYPDDYEKGVEIKIGDLKNAWVYHAGTTIKNGKLVSDGGRILTVSAQGATLKQSIENAYAALPHIKIDGSFYRKDIGKKGL